MGKVSCFKIEGIDCWFWSQEYRHEPHFHAKKRGHWHVRVHFMKAKNVMIERVKGPRGRISSTDANALTNMAEQYRAELLKEWEKTVKCDA
jgi:hypothetical protein